MSDQAISSFENRLSLLESHLYGYNKVPKVSHSPSIPERISNLQQKLTELENSLPALQAFEKAHKNATERGLFYNTNDNLLDQRAKVALIQAAEEDIQESVRQIDLIKEREKHIQPDDWKDVERHSLSLKKLQPCHLLQVEQTNKQSEDVQNALNTYNETISLLSSVFDEWDRVISAQEQKAG